MTSSTSLPVAAGRAVAVHYRLELDGGITAEHSSKPHWYVQGQAGLPSALQKALEGKRQGDRVEVRLSATEAIGERDERLVQRVPRVQLKQAEPLRLSDRVHSTDEGVKGEGLVVALDEETVTLDFNSRLAGAPLTAVLRVEAVADAMPPREL